MRHHLHSECPDDAPSILGPSCHLQLLYSIHRILSPKSADPSNVYATSGTPPVDDGMSGLSTSSPADSRSSEEGIQCAYAHDPCLPLTSKSGHPRCYISVSPNHDNASGYLQSTQHTDISSPTRCDTSVNLLYDHYGDSSAYSKGKYFYRNLSRRNKLRGFNPTLG